MLALSCVAPIVQAQDTTAPSAPTNLRVGSGSTPRQLFNNPIANVFDSYDPACVPAEGSPPYAFANGIRFCDGFEDGEFAIPGCNGGASCDYWTHSDNRAPIPDPHRRGGVSANYTACNFNPSNQWNPAVANFGAAGTPCAMTGGWLDRPYGSTDGDGSSGPNADGSHHVWTNGVAANALAPYGTWHYSVRFYIKFVGTASERCYDAEINPPTGYAGVGNAGDGVCPHTFLLRGSNGWKGIELCDGAGSPCSLSQNGGGTGFTGFATWEGSWAGNMLPGPPPRGDAFDTGDMNQHFNMGLSGSNTLAGIACNGGRECGSIGYNDSPAPPKLSWNAHQNEWIAVELHQSLTNGTGHIEIFMDSCGALGLGCSSNQTQTLWASKYNYDGAFIGASLAIRNLWVNFWARGQTGEIQIDELVFKDRSCAGCDSNIGWMDNVASP